MTRQHFVEIFSNHFISYIKSSFVIILLLLHSFIGNEWNTVAAISSRSSSSSTNAEKFTAFMERQPESTIAPLYDEVQFECGLNMDPDKIEWRFRPQKQRTNNIKTFNDYIYLNKTNGYNITNENSISKLRVYVNQHSAGEYQCIAWLGAAALASIPAKLLLADISVNTSVNPRILHWKVPPGNSILINCGDVISHPPPVWHFFKDNQTVSNSIPQLTGALVLPSVSHENSGTYWCSAVNTLTGIEVKTQQKITVTVDYTSKGPPTLLYNSPEYVIVRAGTTAILECPGVGYPVPKAVWNRSDASISNNRTSIFGYGLQILNTRPEDRGDYICRLDNGISPMKIHRVRLDLFEAPTIQQAPVDTLTDEGERLELDCIAKGVPPPNTYWLINGIDTRLDSNIRMEGTKLIIDSLEKRHAGIVQCFARNDEGEVSESKLLQVKPKQISGELINQSIVGAIPHLSKVNHERNTKFGKGRKKHKHPIMVPPSRPNITRLADDKVMVRWSVPPRDSLPIKFFKVQYRLLGNTPKTTKRSQWMTSNEDIPPTVLMYQVDNLKPDNYYRFRIAAVYSNDDNELSMVSKNFLLQRGSQLDPRKSHLPAPNLTRVEPISEDTVVLHWTLPEHNQTPIDGFYVFYRPASTAGEYSKATVDGMDKRSFRISNLESGTAYEFKLQSYTSSAASDFMAIITGKTLKPSTQSPIDPSVITKNSGAVKDTKPIVLLVAGSTVAGSIIFLTLIVLCLFMKRRKSSDLHDSNENKAHPDHIQADTNGFPIGNITGNGRINSPNHKTSRLNGVVPRMNITPNPMANDGDKNRTVMELRFLPTSLTTGLTNIQENQHIHVANNNCDASPARNQLNRPQQTFNGLPPIQNIGSTTEIGIPQATDMNGRIPSLRRTPRRTTTGNGIPIPNSPRFMRTGNNNDILHHNRSPLSNRVAGVTSSKRHRLGGRNNENISCGSLNSIEV